MIVLSAKESKEPSGLSQLLLGKKTTDVTEFAKFLEAFNANNSAKGMLKNENLDPHLIVVDKTKTTTDDLGNPKNSKEILKETTLMTLLQGENVETDVIEKVPTQKLQNEVLADDERQFLYPKMINTLDPKEIKIILNAAKEYLKEQIDTIVKAQNIELKTVPKTLKGLSEMAKKLGVNLEKITLDQISLPNTSKTQTLLSQPKEPMPLLDMTKQGLVAPIVSLKSTLIAKEKATPKKEEPLKNALHVSVKVGSKTKENVSQTLKEMPRIIEPQASKVSTDNTPQPQVVDPLNELLAGDKHSDTLEHKSIKTNTTESKVSQSSFVNVPASDSLEVKAKEAQQMVRHFATDLKEAVENYKPPFTRLKMTLNPVKLGEVDVTLIQRGNNIHINVSSNNTAVTLLAHNVNDLKTQLANNGVVNTSMQFSTSHEEHQQQEGRHQQFSQAYKNFEQLSEEELEMISSMEIVLPRYA